jgi:nucleotide-binding universal stress UspA family protein
METTTNILIAYDGSEPADAAIDDLALAGLPDGANAVVLSVVDAWLPEEAQPGGKADDALPGLKDIRAAVTQRVEAQRAIAERGAARLRSIFPNWTVTAVACADSPAEAIIRRAEGECGGVDGKGTPADLTVVGSRGLGALKRLVLGSVTQKVMHGLRGSLRIARGRAKAEPSAGGGAPAPFPPARIVVGVDGSADSDAAVAAVAARSWPVGTHILVACYAQGVWGLEHSDAATLAGVRGGIWSGDVARAAGPVDTWVARAAARAVSMIRGCCPGVHVSSVARLGDPSYALVEEAVNWNGAAADVLSDGRGAGTRGGGGGGPERAGADGIFVGARGVRGLERFLLGSVSTTVAMNAHCSVEIVHRRPPRATLPS